MAPYLTQEARAAMAITAERADSAGELNYQVTELVRLYLGCAPNYMEINAAIGALECCKLELYRRIAAPYEDHKARQNGDVFQPRPDIEGGVF